MVVTVPQIHVIPQDRVAPPAAAHLPQDEEETVKVAKLLSQEPVLNRTVEQFVDVPAVQQRNVEVPTVEGDIRGGRMSKEG